MPEQPANDEQAEIKKRAMQRLAVAASLVAAAVVTLTVLNYKKPEQAQPLTTSTAPVAEQTAPPQAEPAAEKPQEEEKPAETPAEPAPPAPEAAAAPATPPAPPPPQVINKAEAPAVPTHAKPRAEGPAALRITQEPSAPAPRQATPITTAPQQQPAPVASPAPEAKPVAAPNKPAKPAAEPSPAKGFAVQLGLFSNPENALQLQKRLAEHGIKSYTETRLQVGPFQTKAEADQALAKIRSLGINAVLTPAR
ncbi:MAG: SPOR domain-containing protein [Sulfuricella sp.]